ncbi:MAG: NADH-quinone oxidoreductase subunit H [Elusimicrobia bacterium]|nr:NADH-quinone oxidoreductase subunit H [Elusimicrobiota bacterium]
MKEIFYYLVFPGFAFSITAGILASWVERKLTARLQWRVGPPILQPLYDIAKLFTKENVIPKNAQIVTFFLAPLLSFAAVLLVSTMVGSAQFLKGGFRGDIIAVVYLLAIPSLCLILGGAASSNPLASFGAAREMKLILSYELIFWTAIAVTWIKTGGLLKLSEIISFQQSGKYILFSPSGFIAFLLAITTMQAKLGRVPFDVAEAETEILAGPYIEYSGPLLGFFKMSQYILLVALPFFLCEIFMGGVNILKYFIMLLLVVLIENTNPRLKITQFLWFSWIILFPIGIIAIILALAGL